MKTTVFSVVPDYHYRFDRLPRHEFAGFERAATCGACGEIRDDIVIADTVGFHMGGRATTRNRVLTTWCYATPGSAWGRGFRTDTVDASHVLPIASRAALA